MGDLQRIEALLNDAVRYAMDYARGDNSAKNKHEAAWNEALMLICALTREPLPTGAAEDALTHFVIPEQAGLDLVRVVLIDHAPGKGTVIVQCYNEAWTTYFGAMGNRTLEQFIASVDRSYLGGALRVRNATYGARIANAVILACRERAALAASTRTTETP